MHLIVYYNLLYILPLSLQLFLKNCPKKFWILLEGTLRDPYVSGSPLLLHDPRGQDPLREQHRGKVSNQAASAPASPAR